MAIRMFYICMAGPYVQGGGGGSGGGKGLWALGTVACDLISSYLR